MSYRGDGNDNNKFIGGAERARREANKRLNGRGPIQSNTKRQKPSCCTLSKSIKPSERFFASLFMSSFSEIAKSNELDNLRHKIMGEACVRAGLPLPSTLSSSHKNAHELYSTRASLVLEETRCILSDALSRTRRQAPPIRVKLASTDERKKTGFWALSFEKSLGSFTQKEMFDMRPGGCFQIVPPSFGKNTSSESSLLGSIVPQFDHDKSGKNDSISLLVYQKSIFKESLQEEGWTIVPVTTLISQVRQFEACTCAKKVAFLPKLLAWKDSTHTRFTDSDDDSEDDETKLEGEEEVVAHMDGNGEETGTDRRTELPNLLKSPFRLSSLNPTQERAANEFLESQPSTLTLVQGPPGTGKTTFMVSVIAKCLLQHSRYGKRRRILVTAPTNKAISVLATRFLDALDDDACFNIAMIGVEDKLVSDPEGYASTVKQGDDPFAISSLSSKLRRIFVYTWMESMVRDFKNLRHTTSLREAADADLIKAKQLKQKLIRNIPGTAKSIGATDMVNQFIQSLENEVSLSSEGSAADKTEARLFRISSLDQFITLLASIDQSTATQEILATADVIFCTLSTAGVSAMKRTRPIDDLFIDEAAAATEPEIYIPFHLRPTRMLAVGDPKQLPAMVTSKHAMAMGLAKSLHERLMFDCHKEHIMLDVQYRMNPSISSFPSKHFYGGKLVNGSNVTRLDYNVDTNILGGKSYSFIQVNGCERQQVGGSYSNVDEAAATVTLVKMLRRSALLQEAAANDSTPWHDPNKIRIITFYQGQVAVLRRMLNQAGLGQVLVATVDSSQGCEADIVILSFVRSNTKRGNVRRSAGFLSDDRRMNVALTRARHQLVCVGNARGTLSQSSAVTLRAIVDDAEERSCVSVEELKCSPDPVKGDDGLLKIK